MLFFLNLDGTVTRSDTDHVYQGQNKVANVELFTLISPVQAAIQVAFTLPNGLISAYMSMSYVGAYSVDESNQKQVHRWKLAVPYNVTEVEGQVGVSFNILQNDGTNGETQETINQTTYTSSFTVEYSALPIPPTTATESELEQLLTLLNLYYTQNASLAAKQPFVVGTVKTNTLDENQQASVAVEQSAVADDNGNYPTNFAFSIPKGATGAAALVYGDTHTEQNEGDIANKSISLPISGFNRTPVVNDKFLLVFNVTESGKSYVAPFTITEVATDTAKASLNGESPLNITGATGATGTTGATGKDGISTWSIAYNGRIIPGTLNIYPLPTKSKVGDRIIIVFKDSSTSLTGLAPGEITSVGSTPSDCIVYVSDVIFTNGEKGTTGATGAPGANGKDGNATFLFDGALSASVASIPKAQVTVPSGRTIQVDDIIISSFESTFGAMAQVTAIGDTTVNVDFIGTLQGEAGASDYNELANKPIINQDLTADGFTPQAGTYYRHTGTGGGTSASVPFGSSGGGIATVADATGVYLNPDLNATAIKTALANSGNADATVAYLPNADSETMFMLYIKNDNDVLIICKMDEAANIYVPFYAEQAGTYKNTSFAGGFENIPTDRNVTGFIPLAFYTPSEDIAAIFDLFVSKTPFSSGGSAYTTGAIYYYNGTEYKAITGETKTSDYNQIENIPVINQDLTASGFTPVANTYYRHTGATTEAFTKGIIYLYDTAYHKLGESGSGGTTLNKYTLTLNDLSYENRVLIGKIIENAKEFTAIENGRYIVLSRGFYPNARVLSGVGVNANNSAMTLLLIDLNDAGGVGISSYTELKTDGTITKDLYSFDKLITVNYWNETEIT